MPRFPVSVSGGEGEGMDGRMLNETTSRRTGDIEFTLGLVNDVSVSVRWFTMGAVSAEWKDGVFVATGSAGTGEVISTGRFKACAYLVGAALEYARCSGHEIPVPIIEFLRDVQEAYRDGLTHRYADQENLGADHARVGWERASA